MEIGIRPFDTADRPACRRLWRELTEHHREIYHDPSIGGGDPGDAFDQHVANAALRGLWIADIREEVVGMVGLLVSGDEAEIEPLIVARKWRGRGVGSELLRHALAEARQTDAAFLNVQPVARNTEAVRLFAGAGFNLVGRVELFTVLKEAPTRKWKDGVRIAGMNFKC